MIVQEIKKRLLKCVPKTNKPTHIVSTADFFFRAECTYLQFYYTGLVIVNDF